MIYDINILTTPFSIVFYVVPLALMVVLTIIRAGVLLSCLFRSGARRRLDIERVLEGAMSPDDLARAALANRVSPDQLSEDRLVQLRSTSRAEVDAALRTLRAADARFEFLWQHMMIRVSSTWNLMRLTVLAAGFITAFGFFPQLSANFYGSRGTIIIAGLDKALFETGVWALAQLALGFAVAGVLCVVAMVFDGLLQRRLASWKYFYASARDALSDTQSRASSEQ